MNTRFASILTRFIIGGAVIVGAAWLVMNRQAVVDWYRLQTYKPSAEVLQLASNDTLLGRGRDLFYVSDPHIQDSTAFNKSCSNQGEETIVLGCYKLQTVYVYNVTDARLNGVKEVTAAHEMLHAAYERLSDAERQRVDDMLRPIIQNMKDQRILDLVNLYNKQEPGQLYNEMHSILGTEYAGLTPELEDYYKQYFADRHKVVAYAAQYQAVFTQSKDKLNQYDQQLNTLKAQVDQDNASLKQQQQQLQSLSDQLDTLRAQGNVAQYNQLVPDYNAKAQAFNTLVEQTRALVRQYNDIVVVRNQEAAAQDNLYQSLDSNYQPAAPQTQ